MPNSPTTERSQLHNQALSDLKAPLTYPARALSCYKKTIEIAPYRLGILIKSHSLEVHILATVDNEPRILDQVELTGMRKKDRTIQTPGGAVHIAKHDRGKLRFVFSEQSMAVTFSNLSKPGGMSVSVVTAQLDERGKPRIGATFQKHQTIFIPRLPAHEGEIEHLTCAVATDTRHFSGLSDPLSVSAFCIGLKHAFAGWESSMPRERILAIRLVANETLLNSGVYPCYFPEGIVSDWGSFSPRKLCRFVPAEWSMYRSPDFVDETHLSRQDQLEFATALYEELRTVEQTWNVLRYVTGKDTGILDAARLPSELSKVALCAQQLAIPQDHLSATRYDLLLDSITSVTKEGCFLGEFYRHEPTLSLDQRLRRKLNLPYLYHQRDAAAVANLVRREWNR
jgi:hypothetical protein